MKGEFYKMEFDAWDEGTVDLTLEEEAAYLRLCHQMYRRRGAIPNSDRLLCALWRCHQNKARPLLQRLIDKGKIRLTQDGHLTNTRVTREVDDRETLAIHRAHAGHTGGIRSGDARRKSLKTQDTGEAKRSREDKIREEEKREEKTLQLKLVETGITDIAKADEGFEDWWRVYPRKIDKGAARKIYERVIKSGKATSAELMAAVLRYAAERRTEDPKFTKHAATWLNAEGWLNEPQTVGAVSSSKPVSPANAILWGMRSHNSNGENQ